MYKGEKLKADATGLKNWKEFNQKVLKNSEVTTADSAAVAKNLVLSLFGKELVVHDDDSYSLQDVLKGDELLEFTQIHSFIISEMAKANLTRFAYSDISKDTNIPDASSVAGNLTERALYGKEFLRHLTPETGQKMFNAWRNAEGENGGKDDFGHLPRWEQIIHFKQWIDRKTNNGAYNEGDFSYEGLNFKKTHIFKE